jgi:guanyl-specific ribonuclease Sa
MLVDPQLQNSYSYARNNPLMYNDPDGQMPRWLEKRIVAVGDWANRQYENNSAARFLLDNPELPAIVGAIPFEVAVAAEAIAVGAGSYAVTRLLNSCVASCAATSQEIATVGPRLLPGAQPQKALPAPAQPTRFVTNAEVNDYGRITKGTVDLKPTFDRIQTGRTLPQFRNDGSVYANDGRGGSALLPSAADPNYYTEHVIITPGISGRPGPQRLVTGRGGEAYYTGDHYKSFTKVRDQAQ